MKRPHVFILVAIVLSICVSTAPEAVMAQWSSVPYGEREDGQREDGDRIEQYQRWQLDSRGLFGMRRLGTPRSPERSSRFEGTGIRRSSAGAFMGIDATAPTSMFPPNRTSDAELARSSVPAQLPVRPARPLAETRPWPADQIPPAAVADQAAGASPSPHGVWTSPDGWQRPPLGRPGPREEVWMRSPGQGAPGASSGAMSASQRGMVPGVGPQGTFGSTPTTAGTATQPPRGMMSPEDNQRTALRLAKKVIQARGVQPLSPITVRYAAGVATIEGAVATDFGRTLAAQILMADPLVRQVRNTLRVAGPRAVSPLAGGEVPMARPESYDAPPTSPPVSERLAPENAPSEP